MPESSEQIIVRLGSREYPLVTELAAFTTSIRKYEQVIRKEPGFESCGFYDFWNKLARDERPSQTEVEVMFYALAKAKNPQWSVAYVRSIVTVMDYPQLLTAIVTAIAGAVGANQQASAAAEEGDAAKVVPFEPSPKPSAPSA